MRRISSWGRDLATSHHVTPSTAHGCSLEVVSARPTKTWFFVPCGFANPRTHFPREHAEWRPSVTWGIRQTMPRNHSAPSSTHARATIGLQLAPRHARPHTRLLSAQLCNIASKNVHEECHAQQKRHGERERRTRGGSNTARGSVGDVGTNGMRGGVTCDDQHPPVVQSHTQEASHG